jgi:hypothetical protein
MPTRYASIINKNREQLITDLEAETDRSPGGFLDPLATTLYVNQLHHLDANEQATRIEKYTRYMLWLTVAVTVLTVVNVALVAYTILCPITH